MKKMKNKISKLFNELGYKELDELEDKFREQIFRSTNWIVDEFESQLYSLIEDKSDLDENEFFELYSDDIHDVIKTYLNNSLYGCRFLLKDVIKDWKQY